LYTPPRDARFFLFYQRKLMPPLACQYASPERTLWMICSSAVPEKSLMVFAW
jgi:hypothetical protein